MGIIRKQSVSSAIISYIGVAIGFLATGIIMPKIFSASEIGLFKLVISVSGLFAAIFSFGISQIIVKSFYEFVSSKASYKKYVIFVLRNLTISSFLVAPFFFLSTELSLDSANSTIEFAKSTEFLIFMYALIVSRIYFIGIDSLLKIRKKVVISVTIQNIVLKLYPVLVYLLFYLNIIDFNTSIIFYISIYFILPFIGWYYLRINKFEDIDISEEKVEKSNRFRLGVFGTLTTIGSATVLFLDTIMVNKILDENATGIYAVMFMFGMVVSVPARPLRSIAQSLISDSFSKQDLDKVREIYVKSCRSLFVIGAVIFLVISCCIPVLLDFLDDQYRIGLPVIYFIGIGYLIDMSTGVNSEFIVASKYYWLGTPLTLLLMLLTIITNIVFIPIYGITGAAIATCLTLAISNLIKIILIKVLFKSQPFNLKYVFGILVFSGIIIIQYNFSFVDNIWINAILETIIFSGALLTILYLLRVSEDVNQMVNRILFRFFNINLDK